MRKNRILSLVFAAVTLVLLLGSCSQADYNRQNIVGTWEGDGTLELYGMELELGEEVPFEVVEILHFAADGTGYMACGTEKMEYKYVMTDDTISFQFPGIGMGRGYEFKDDNNILIVSGSEFRRIA